MSLRPALGDDPLLQKLGEKDIFKIKLSLSCLSNKVFVCSAVANLYIWQPPIGENTSNSWQYVRTGIPAIVVSTGLSGARNPKGMSISLMDKQSGFCVWKEHITSNSNYREQQPNFHVLALSSGDGVMAGLRFANEDSASLFYKDVISNLDDVLQTSSSPEIEIVQGSPTKERFKKFRKLKKNEISSPCLFSHVTSITNATLVGDGVNNSSDSDNSHKDSKKSMNGHSGRTANLRRAFSVTKKRR
ncbi:uncharacterized protein LOC110233052 [Exaiptasia diaphana]|uniref:WH1 domain-containing protein n=1 Tax=Exaiptasia diaphana TaxID=2652724 RepID=A0A913WTQ3_EXADI|nr:uncharacterized protein LOC110233052 [Exaiptasia diaphana]